MIGMKKLELDTNTPKKIKEHNKFMLIGPVSLCL